MILPTRRNLLQTVGLATLAACSPGGVGNATQEGVLTLDWALAETMIALGRSPAGVVAGADWKRFVIEPKLPEKTADLGLQQELNFELMASLKPTLILFSPFLEHLKPKFDRIARSEKLSVYDPSETPLGQRMQVSRDLAALIGAESALEDYLLELEILHGDVTKRLSRLKQRPILMVSFIDNRHARVYSGSSLYADAMAWLGLENAWQRDVGYFGFSTVGLEDLATQEDVELIAVEPIPPDISHALAESPLWTKLPFVVSGHHGTIPPVFMFGGLPSAARFAELIVAHLEARWG
ncbi:ABC transporter substrate-binding protein [Henriciella aquimarina]|uniref:ABC transporter substrate-binding protein n=1 Tax=Henriciella aquimarina TaxID=545261 RepID=UPI0009FDCE25|nr:ABC transporter substrate-binding protein [Henriciella aquimarina]